jgi:hypothetical protein
VQLEANFDNAFADRQEETKRRNTSIAEWQQPPKEELKDAGGQSTLTSLLTQLGAFFTWDAAEVEAPSPIKNLDVVECQYCKKMIKMVNETAIDEHEEECQR